MATETDTKALFRSPEIPSHDHNNIILLLMVKNEERIIERCLSHAMAHVDAVAILDTGSSDHTVERCERFLSDSGKPFKISVEEFKNFGYNRTISFEKAQKLCLELNWDAEKTYVMAIDADMIIESLPAFKSYRLASNGHRVFQKNGNLNYYNTRFMRCSYPWKCIGATHECWSGDDANSRIPREIFRICDKNDGGCKSDKFERDIRLLSEEITIEPNNARAHFYLAQSLKDIGQFKESIAHYKKRIALGGWHEEVWYAHFQIGECYEQLKQIHKMELWMNRAFDLHPRRAEPLYHMTKYFRIASQHHKAYHYYLKGRYIPYPKEDILFIDESVYNGLFDYENTILAYYVHGKTRQESLHDDLIPYINREIPYQVDNVWRNMHYYIESLTSATYRGLYTKFDFPVFEEYGASSCCVLPPCKEGGESLLMNVRYVNYSIDSKHCYHMRSAEEDSKAPHEHVYKTRNGRIYLNSSSYLPTEKIALMNEELPQTHPSNVQGLEDVRLFAYRNKIYFTASNKSLTPTGDIVIALGEYCPESCRMSNVKVIRSPLPECKCEKNWIAVPENALESVVEARDRMNFIYAWYPLQIGAISDSDQLVIHTRYETPNFFSRFRGSTPLCDFDGKLWCVVHYIDNRFVDFAVPRAYYHLVVQLNRKTLKPEQYSAPFCFRRIAIEYCLGLHVTDNSFCFFFSEYDSEPGFIVTPRGNVKFLAV